MGGKRGNRKRKGNGANTNVPVAGTVAGSVVESEADLAVLQPGAISVAPPIPVAWHNVGRGARLLLAKEEKEVAKKAEAVDAVKGYTPTVDKRCETCGQPLYLPESEMAEHDVPQIDINFLRFRVPAQYRFQVFVQLGPARYDHREPFAYIAFVDAFSTVEDANKCAKELKSNKEMISMGIGLCSISVIDTYTTGMLPVPRIASWDCEQEFHEPHLQEMFNRARSAHTKEAAVLSKQTSAIMAAHPRPDMSRPAIEAAKPALERKPIAVDTVHLQDGSTTVTETFEGDPNTYVVPQSDVPNVEEMIDLAVDAREAVLGHRPDE